MNLRTIFLCSVLVVSGCAESGGGRNGGLPDADTNSVKEELDDGSVVSIDNVSSVIIRIDKGMVLPGEERILEHE